jgi:PAS domain S-box-containing protein
MSSEFTYEELRRRNQYLEEIVKRNESIDNLRLKLALSYGKIGIHVWEMTRDEFVWDELMYEYWGIPFGTRLNLDLVLKAIHPDDKEIVKKEIAALTVSGPGEKWNIQLRVTGIDTGIFRWLELTGHVDYENNKPVRIIGTAIDITERKAGEEEKKRWENVFRYARWGTAIASASDDTFELINPEYASMHGYSVEELTGKPVTTVFAPETKGDLASNKLIAHEKGHHVYETVHVRKDGSRFPVNIDITTVYNENGVPSYRILGVTDISERKNAEQAIRESDNHYRLLFQNLNSNFAAHEIILDEKGNPIDYRFLEVNSAMEKATGYKASEMIGKTARELFPKTEQYWIDKFAEVANTGLSSVYENYSKELGRYYELILYSPKKGEFAMLATDTTERKLAEQKLQEAKDNFKLLFDLNPDAVNIIRVSDRHIISVNSGFTNMLGYTPEEVVGKTTTEVNLWIDANERIGILDKIFRDKYCDNFEAHFRCKNGKEIVGIVSARIVDIYGSEHFLTVTRDISLRKQYELALKENERILKESQKIAELGSYKLDFVTGHWEGSEILDTILGIDSSYDKSIEGWVNLIHPEWREIMVDYLQNDVITKKQKFDKEYKILSKTDSKEKWVHGLGKLFFDEDGALHYMTGTIMDITSRKNAEITIQKQNDELIKLNATKDMVFSIIAHDLRSPLGSLMYSNELLSNFIKEGNISKAEEWCSTMKSVSYQTYELLENLLEWFKVQTGQMSPEFSEYDLKSIVDEVVTLFSGTAAHKNIRIQNKITGVLFVCLDREITKAIIRNLINNAIKFTPGSGLVTIQCISNLTNIEITVSDTGVGIADEALPGLFSFNTNKSTIGTDKEKGSGLGLNICKELVEIQGGRIWVESRVNKGSDFHFTIPVKRQFIHPEIGKE